jgi:hypothetical protein
MVRSFKIKKGFPLKPILFWRKNTGLPIITSCKTQSVNNMGLAKKRSAAAMVISKKRFTQLFGKNEIVRFWNEFRFYDSKSIFPKIK